MCPHHSTPDPAHRVRSTDRAEQHTRRFFLFGALALAAFSLCALLIPLTLAVPPAATGAISWRPTAIGAAVVLGLLLWELRGAWILLSVGIVLLELPPLFTQELNLTSLATFSQTLLIGLLLGFSGTVILRLSRSADVAAAGRARATAAAASAAGVSTARAQTAALVHDEVLSVLALAASPYLVNRQKLAEQAARSRSLLADASADEAQVPPVEALREDVATLDPRAAFTVLGSASEHPPVIPSTVLPVIRNALRQALRNSLLHAGPSAQREVTVTHDSARIRVVVADDGIGFNPSQVSTWRLGLRTSAQAVKSIGGDLSVQSGSGIGTQVCVEWPAASSETTASGIASVSAPLPTRTSDRQHAQSLPESVRKRLLAETTRLGDVPLVQVGVTVTAATFMITQTMLAAVATSTAEPKWVPFLLLALLFAAALILQQRFGARLSTARTVLVFCLLGIVVSLGLLSSRFEVGELWFTGAAAFLITAIAFRGRPIAAASGGLVMSVMLVTSGLANDSPPLMIAAVSVRPLGVICVAVALSLSVAFLLRHITRDFAATETASARESWEHSARVELATQANEVRGLVDHMLTAIASGTPLDDHLRARAGALEGHLRDRIRAGRLAIEPLMTTVMQARERGVDVVLLDDLDGDLPPHFDLSRAVTHLATACDDAVERVTVRILPSGRTSVISLTVDGVPVTLAENH